MTPNADGPIANSTQVPHVAFPTAPQPLRSRLFMLAASGLAPLMLAAILGIASLIHDRSVGAQRSALELSRALATGVDAELKSAIAVLEALALSDELKAGQAGQFHALSQRAAQQRGWRGILLADASGRIVMSSRCRPIWRGCMHSASASRSTRSRPQPPHWAAATT